MAISPATPSSTTRWKLGAYTVWPRSAHPVEQRDEAPAVERLDRALAVVQPEAVEGRVGQVEPVHRQVNGDARSAAIELLDERDRQGGLAAAGASVMPRRNRMPGVAARSIRATSSSRASTGGDFGASQIPKLNGKVNFKGVGQECPTHTNISV